MTVPAILVVGPSWVGDMVMAQSLFMTLAERFPGAPVDVLAPGWSLPVIARMPQVRTGIEMPLGHGKFGWRARRRLGLGMRNTGYGRAIVLPRSFKSALVPFHAAIPVRTGYRGEMRFGLINDMRALDKTVLSTTVSRYVALGYPADSRSPPPILSPQLTIDKSNQARLVDKLELGDGSVHVIGLMPGAEYGPAKQWPVEYFAELGRRLVAAGYDVWIFGSQKDKPVGDAISAAGGRSVSNLCGQTGLADVIDLIAATDAVVSNDSGLMHVAAATGRHVVAIYGSSSPQFTPPLTKRASIQYLDIDCSPCFDRTCRFGHYRCLRDIRVEAILQALQSDPAEKQTATLDSRRPSYDKQEQ